MSIIVKADYSGAIENIVTKGILMRDMREKYKERAFLCLVVACIVAAIAIVDQRKYRGEGIYSGGSGLLVVDNAFYAAAGILFLVTIFLAKKAYYGMSNKEIDAELADHSLMMKPESYAEFREHLRRIEGDHRINAGALFLREGDPAPKFLQDNTSLIREGLDAGQST